MKRKNLILPLWFLLGSCCTTAVAAQLTVHPRVTLQEEYNDNIYLVAENPTADYITTVSPGVAVNYVSRPLTLDLDYGFYFRWYQDNSQEDENSLRDTQRGRGTLTLFPQRPFTLTVFDQYSKVFIDPRLPTVEENDFVNRTILNQLVVNPQYRFQASPTFVAILGYRYENLAYKAEAGDDSQGNLGHLELRKNLASQFDVALVYDIEQRNNRWSDDYLRHTGTLGFSRQFSRLLTVDARAGAGRVEYNHLERFNRTIFVGDFNARFALTERLAATLHYGEDFAIATIDGLYRRSLAEVRLGFGAVGSSAAENRGNAELVLSWSRDDYNEIARIDRSLGGRLGARIPLGKLLAVLASASYAHLNFTPVTEKVDRYGVGAGVEVRLLPVIVSLNYLYRDSNSDIDFNDYQNNLVVLSATLQF